MNTKQLFSTLIGTLLAAIFMFSTLAYAQAPQDTNNDGKIDFNEFITHSEQRFQTMDINSDGYVTPEEARAGHKLMREKMKQAFKERRQTERDSQEAGS